MYLEPHSRPRSLYSMLLEVKIVCTWQIWKQISQKLEMNENLTKRLHIEFPHYING